MKLDADQRRALALLAGGPRGCVEAMFVDVHGFIVDALAALVRLPLRYARDAPGRERKTTVVRMHRGRAAGWWCCG